MTATRPGRLGIRSIILGGNDDIASIPRRQDKKAITGIIVKRGHRIDTMYAEDFNMLSFLRETNPDGSAGHLSSRRIAAFLLILLSLPLFYLGFQHSEHGWTVYIPGALCLVLATVLFMFTTITDVKEIVEAAAAFKKK
jgi:hypothetical protein